MNAKVLCVFCLSVVVSGATRAASAEDACVAPEGLSTALAGANVRFLVFGEIHGSVEAPAFFAESVCAVAASGKKVLVGLEFPEETTAIFQNFMQSEGGAEDVSTLLRESSWEQQASRFPDGRTSMAMLALVARLRELRANGHAVTIAPFVRSGLEMGDPYETGMASSLIEADSNGDYDLVMILVGNVHAYGAKVNFGTSYQPMAMHLPRSETLTLQMVSEGGTAWNCQSDGCGAHPLRASTSDKAIGIKVGKDLAQGYDGIFRIGKASASPPATVSP